MINSALPEIAMAAPANLHHVMGHDPPPPSCALRYQNRQFFEVSSYVLAALGNSTQYRQRGYTKTDLTLTCTASESRWYIQGFAKNLENEIVVSSVASGTFAFVQIADPRTYGMRAGFKF